jgi:SAM-dependent methyltransferase
VSLKDVVIRTLWGDRFYRAALAPFDGWLVEPQPAAAFAGLDVPVNKVCRMSDADNESWCRGFDDLGFPPGRDRFHRKIWEFNQTLYGLRRLRRLAPEAHAIGIGCGHEELMYFLANRIARVVATDVYEGAFLGGEGDADVLEHPEKYAPFPYRQPHLEVRRMNGLSLDAPASTFDFTFCLSSIEHFGSLADKLQALREMFRVLKPGGVAVVTTEAILNRLGRGEQYFRPEVLLRLIGDAGFSLDGAPDLRVEREFAAAPLALPMDAFVTPHVVLRNFNTIYTSVALFLMKPGDSAATGDEVQLPAQAYRYAADFTFGNAPTFASERPITVEVVVRNCGNATWFAGPGRSHVVRMGAWWVAHDARNLTGEPLRFELPRHVAPGESVPLRLTLAPPHGAAALHLGLVKELCFWFRDRGGADVVVPLGSL